MYSEIHAVEGWKASWSHRKRNNTKRKYFRNTENLYNRSIEENFGLENDFPAKWHCNE